MKAVVKQNIESGEIAPPIDPIQELGYIFVLTYVPSILGIELTCLD